MASLVKRRGLYTFMISTSQTIFVVDSSAAHELEDYELRATRKQSQDIVPGSTVSSKRILIRDVTKTVECSPPNVRGT